MACLENDKMPNISCIRTHASSAQRCKQTHTSKRTHVTVMYFTRIRFFICVRLFISQSQRYNLNRSRFKTKPLKSEINSGYRNIFV